MLPIREVLGLPGIDLSQNPCCSVIGWEHSVEAWAQRKGGWFSEPAAGLACYTLGVEVYEAHSHGHHTYTEGNSSFCKCSQICNFAFMSLEYPEITQDFNIILSRYVLVSSSYFSMYVFIFLFNKYQLGSWHCTGQPKKWMKCSLERVWPAQWGTQGYLGKGEVVKRSKWRRKNRVFRVSAKFN